MHRREDVAVGVHRHGDRRVAEALLHDLGLNAAEQDQRGRRMPQVVSPRRIPVVSARTYNA